MSMRLEKFEGLKLIEMSPLLRFQYVLKCPKMKVKYTSKEQMFHSTYLLKNSYKYTLNHPKKKKLNFSILVVVCTSNLPPTFLV